MKWSFFIIAWISFILGFIGIFLPILPTTPFFILSAYLFSKSSPRFHKWVLTLPVAGPGIEDWEKHRVIKTSAKILCTAMIFLSLGIIWGIGEIIVPIKIFVSLLIVSVNVFVVTRKSK